MKVLGSLLIIGATSLFGCRMAIDMEQRYAQMKELRQIMYLLQSEIAYSRAFLAEAFLRISRQTSEPYSVWLRQMYYRMQKRTGGTFEQVWYETIQEYLISARLPSQEKKRLEELGKCLGSPDAGMQVKSIDLYEEQLALSMHEVKEGLRTKKRLCHCLGVMSGIFLAILLI